MKRFIGIALIVLGLGVGLTLMVSTPSKAVHKGVGDLTCGGCHTMHSSQGNDNSPSMGGTTGSFILLKANVGSRAEIHKLCLQCHAENGSQADTVWGVPEDNYRGGIGITAPKVYLTNNPWSNTMYDLSGFQNVGAGGDFSSVGSYNGSTFILTPGVDDVNALGRGHSIGGTDGLGNATPPGNTTIGIGPNTNAIIGFTCTSCHDPHGTTETTNNINTYRNLKANSMPTGVQNVWTDMAAFGDLGKSYVGGTTPSNRAPAPGYRGTDPTGVGNVWPIWGNGGLSQNSYFSVDAVTNKTGVLVGVSRFCGQCHGAWHEGLTAGNNVDGDDWRRHPVGNQLVGDGTPNSGAGVDIVRFGHYNQQGSDNSRRPYDPLVEATKLPAAQSQITGTTYYADDPADRVFCLSCHFPHGSPNYDILRWNYTKSVIVGDQAGQGIASNTGCQQCHNR